MEFSQTDSTNLIISTRRIISSNLQKKKMVRERERKFCLTQNGIIQHCSNCLQKSNLPQTGETCIMQNLKSIPKLIILLAVPYQSGTDGPICQGTIRWPKPWNINVYRWWFCKTKWSQTIFGNLHPPFQLLSVQKSR